jgi:hypothetical protein
MKRIEPLCFRVVRLAYLCVAFLPVTSFATSSFFFVETGSLATPRAYQTAIPLPDGKILGTGGNQGLTVTATAEVYARPIGISGRQPAA